MTTAHQEWRDNPGDLTFQEWCRARDRAEADRLDAEAVAEEKRAAEWEALAAKAERAKDETAAQRAREEAVQFWQNMQALRDRAGKLRRYEPCG